MFIERLNKKQVEDFLNEQYNEDEYDYEFALDKSGKFIMGSVKKNGEPYDTFSLYDFEVLWSWRIWADNWMKYLYKVFGEEYKEVCLSKCDSLKVYLVERAKIFE